jgi:hypothetical protein
MQRRVRSKPYSFEERIAAEKARAEEQLATTRTGLSMTRLLTASRVNDWLRSPR